MRFFNTKGQKNPLVEPISPDEVVSHVMDRGKAYNAPPGITAKEIKCPMCKSEIGYLVLDAHNLKWKTWACTAKACIAINGDKSRHSKA